MTRWAGVWATSMVNVIFKVESHDGRMYHGVGLHGQAVRTEAITPLTVEDNRFLEDYYAVETEQECDCGCDSQSAGGYGAGGGTTGAGGGD